ncbi:hypothetical protein CYMTET_5927 [Cymbomonas tetramitiformis]|uniref:Uncharacterized protein n=1 Tax=Cymbomonas tetramitiformis TaxID=36881 RepID=A0AAE0GYH0_9CHLO|nr:hypothetical protein CYMTET_5927 [Cymbomonas tetramitiformis]
MAFKQGGGRQSNAHAGASARGAGASSVGTPDSFPMRLPGKRQNGNSTLFEERLQRIDAAHVEERLMQPETGQEALLAESSLVGTFKRGGCFNLFTRFARGVDLPVDGGRREKRGAALHEGLGGVKAGRDPTELLIVRVPQVPSLASEESLTRVEFKGAAPGARTKTHSQRPSTARPISSQHKGHRRPETAGARRPGVPSKSAARSQPSSRVFSNLPDLEKEMRDIQRQFPNVHLDRFACTTEVVHDLSMHLASGGGLPRKEQRRSAFRQAPITREPHRAPSGRTIKAHAAGKHSANATVASATTIAPWLEEGALAAAAPDSPMRNTAPPNRASEPQDPANRTPATSQPQALASPPTDAAPTSHAPTLFSEYLSTALPKVSLDPPSPPSARGLSLDIPHGSGDYQEASDDVFESPPISLRRGARANERAAAHTKAPSSLLVAGGPRPDKEAMTSGEPAGVAPTASICAELKGVSMPEQSAAGNECGDSAVALPAEAASTTASQVPPGPAEPSTVPAAVGPRPATCDGVAPTPAKASPSGAGDTPVTIERDDAKIPTASSTSAKDETAAAASVTVNATERSTAAPAPGAPMTEEAGLEVGMAPASIAPDGSVQTTAEPSLLSGTGDKDVIAGTGDKDVIAGTGDKDVIAGTGDKDAIAGTGDKDVIAGTSDKDVIAGSDDRDVNAGSGDKDAIAGTGDKDVIAGTGDKDVIAGTGDKDVIAGTGDKDVIAGTGDKDVIAGTGDKDVIAGTGDKDAIAGTGDKDVIAGTSDKDVIAGSDDRDVNAGSGDKDAIACTGDKDVIAGTGDKDVIAGTGDKDVITGTGDKDAIAGTGDRDVNAGSGDKDAIAGTGDKDVIAGTSNKDVIAGSGDKDVIAGTGDRDVIAGSGDKDAIAGTSVPSEALEQREAPSAASEAEPAARSEAEPTAEDVAPDPAVAADAPLPAVTSEPASTEASSRASAGAVPPANTTPSLGSKPESKPTSRTEPEAARPADTGSTESTVAASAPLETASTDVGFSGDRPRAVSLVIPTVAEMPAGGAGISPKPVTPKAADASDASDSPKSPALQALRAPASPVPSLQEWQQRDQKHEQALESACWSPMSRTSRCSDEARDNLSAWGKSGLSAGSGSTQPVGNSVQAIAVQANDALIMPQVPSLQKVDALPTVKSSSEAGRRVRPQSAAAGAERGPTQPAAARPLSAAPNSSRQRSIIQINKEAVGAPEASIMFARPQHTGPKIILQPTLMQVSFDSTQSPGDRRSIQGNRARFPRSSAPASPTPPRSSRRGATYCVNVDVTGRAMNSNAFQNARSSSRGGMGRRPTSASGLGNRGPTSLHTMNLMVEGNKAAVVGGVQKSPFRPSPTNSIPREMSRPGEVKVGSTLRMTPIILPRYYS